MKITRDTLKTDGYWTAVIGITALTLVLTKSLTAGVFVFSIIILSFLFYIFVLPEILKERENPIEAELPSVPEIDDDMLVLGEMESNGFPVAVELESLNHMFIIGMTRYGKTRLVLSLVTEFITKYPAETLKLAFSDAKYVSFNVFGRSKHLFAPIARNQEQTEQLIELVLTEMRKRQALFSDYHDKICTNIEEYYELTGETLPRIIVIFDEVADSIESGSIAEKNLTTLAKMGLATGIHLILITQRPTKIGISHEIISQCQTIMSTYMKNQIEYGSVAKIPASMYKEMQPVKGLFMAFSPDLAPTFLEQYPDGEGWGFVRSKYIANHVIEGIAITDSAEELDIPSLETSIPAWKGSEEDKLDAIKALEEKLGEDVTPEDMKKYFGVGRRTATTWLEKYYSNVVGV